MMKYIVSIIFFIFPLFFHSCEKIEYVYMYELDTIYLPNVDQYHDYDVVVVSKNNGDFSTLKEVSLTLESGKYLIYLPDSLYEENVDCNIDIKEGWILKGRGIEHTKVIFRDVNPKAHSYNINIIGSSEIRDLRLVSITTEADSRYCLHLDDHRINDLRFLCHNVMMEGIWENDNGMQDNGNMLVCGIGLWDNWNITFRNCIIKGDERIKTFRHGFGVINLHNNDCEYPGMVIFDNCKIISNGNAILIRDYRFQYDNDYRLKDSISFINTEVNGFLVGYAQHAARNGYHFTVSNSSVDGIIGAQYLADYTFPLSYTIFSLPLFNNIRYLNNLSGRNLKAGSLVKMEYDAKEYYWNIDDRAPVVIGFNIDEVDCDAILLSGVSSNGSAHILMSGVGRIGDWYEIDCSAGDYIRMEHNKLTTSSERTNIVYLGERYVRISR